VAEAFILEEVSTFTQAYYTEALRRLQDPTPRYNIDENSCTLSLFRGDLERAGVGTNVYLLHVEWHTIMMYLLLNLDETQDYQE
jgi:hypothetical protein